MLNPHFGWFSSFVGVTFLLGDVFSMRTKGKIDLSVFVPVLVSYCFYNKLPQT